MPAREFCIYMHHWIIDSTSFPGFIVQFSNSVYWSGFTLCMKADCGFSSRWSTDKQILMKHKFPYNSLSSIKLFFAKDFTSWNFHAISIFSNSIMREAKHRIRDEEKSTLKLSTFACCCLHWKRSFTNPCTKLAFKMIYLSISIPLLPYENCSATFGATIKIKYRSREKTHSHAD